MPDLPRLEAIIGDRNTNPTGPGPLANIQSLSYERVINGLGSWEATLPLRDPRTDLIVNKKTVLEFLWNDATEFYGLVEQTDTIVEPDGTLLLRVSGRDHGADLAEAKVGFFSPSVGGLAYDDMPARILFRVSPGAGPPAGTMPNVWVMDDVEGYLTTAGESYMSFGGDSAMAALIKVAEKLGEHFRIDEDAFRIVWLRDEWPDSGVRAIQGAPDMVAAQSNNDVCFFQTLRDASDAGDMFTRIYPYMAGRLEMTPGLIATNRIAPAGFTLDPLLNYISSDTEETSLGHAIPIYVQFPDIRPVSNTDADLQSASNQIFDSAIAMLKQNDSIADFETFTMGNVVQLPSSVKPGTSIRVLYEDDRYSINKTMLVHRVRTYIGPDASRSHSLTIAATSSAPASDTEFVGNALADGRAFQTQPIMSPNSYELAFSKPIWNNGTDPAENATIYFDFDDEVTQIQRVLFKFETANGTQMLPLESTVIGTDTTGTAIGNEGSHTHDIPDHSHTFRIIGNGAGALTYDVGFGAGGTSGGLRHNIDTSDYNAPTNPDTGSTTSEAGESHTHSFAGDVNSAYGVHREAGTSTFERDDVTISVNGGAPISLTAGGPIGGNRYEIDVTDQLYNTTTFRPLQAHNTITVSGTQDGDRESCTIDGVLKIRTIIQTTAVT